MWQQRRSVAVTQRRGQPLVDILTAQLDQFGPQRHEDLLGTDVGVGTLGAPPGELRAALTPVPGPPLTEDPGGVLVVVDMVVEAKRQLPTDVRFPVEGPFAVVLCPHVERTPGSACEVRSVEKDAGAVMGARDPVAVGILPERPTEIVGHAGKLPLAVVEACDVLLDPSAVGLVREVGPMGTAAVLILGSTLLLDTGAAGPVDTGPAAGQKSGVDEPGVTVTVVEREPLVEIVWYRHGGAGYSAVPRLVQNEAMARDPDAGAVPVGLRDELTAILDPDGFHTDAVDLALHAGDSSLLRGRAGAVCLPRTSAQVAAVVRATHRHGHPVVARGAGTGLAGGAVPLDDAVVVVTTRLDAIESVDLRNRVAWVQPGVVNLDLDRRLRPRGWHFAPDPSSQQACTLGGNVATNSGGPHCLAYGVTNAHVAALDVVLGDGSTVRLGGIDPEPPGLDVRGAFVGSEGTFGITTRVAVRLTRTPRAHATLLADFTSVGDAAEAVSEIIASGIVPAALEMMDGAITSAAESFVHAGYPTDAAAVLLIEIDGLPDGVEQTVQVVQSIVAGHGSRHIRRAADETERALLWKGRKAAFGAVARIMPNYYLHDTVIPRRHLSDMLERISAIAEEHRVTIMNVFHAGDGNLHPLVVFDAREAGVLERVHAAGRAIVEASLGFGGVLSGEHGIGLEKRDFMALQFSESDLAAQEKLRRAFDPDGLMNPAKVLPSGSRCGDIRDLPVGAWI